ncbi:MAG: hypothetical protein WAN11_16455 [Syntrophobacteraceae bacterium]
MTRIENARRNADPIWLHQNGMWEYMGRTEDDDLFSTYPAGEEVRGEESD